MDEMGKSACGRIERSTLPAIWCIPAIGQSPLLEMLARFRDLKVEQRTRRGGSSDGADEQCEVLRGWRLRNGGREVVDAVAEGKRARSRSRIDWRR